MGAATATGTLVNAGNNRAASCLTSSGADVVYSVVLAAGTTLTATVTPTGSSWRPAITLFGNGTCSGSLEQACGWSPANGSPVTVTSGPLSAGTWYLWVESQSGQPVGTFTLNLTTSVADAGVPDAGVDAGSGPTADSCADVIALPTTAGPHSRTGTLAGGADDRTPSCAPNPSSDRVYSVQVSHGQQLVASAAGIGWMPALSLTTGATCQSATEFDCFASPSTVSSATLITDRLDAGTYFLWVDSAAGTPGTFFLDHQLASPPNAETCSSALPLQLLPRGPFSTATSMRPVTDTLVGRADDLSHQCSSSGNIEAAYAVSVGAGQTLNVTIQPEATLRPAILLSGPRDFTQPLSCAYAGIGGAPPCLGASVAGQSFTYSRANLAAGVYLIQVESMAGGSPGRFTLSTSVTLGGTADGRPADSCAAPELLTFSNGLAIAEGTTENDFSGDFYVSACGNQSPDRVYAFTLTQPRSLRAWLVPQSPFQPALALSGAGCTSANNINCNRAPDGGVAEVEEVLPAGTYYLWVDGYSYMNVGRYKLAVSIQ